MNSMATTGKNLQTAEPLADDKMAYEIRPVSPSATIDTSTRVFTSLASRKRVPSAPSRHQLNQPFPAQPKSRTARNYGNRRLRYRWVHQLKPWQVHDWYAADAVATQLGTPLNTFVTIAYGATFPGEAAMTLTFKRGKKLMVQWFRDKGLPAAYLYGHENPDDARPNSHLLIHVPKHLRRAFKAKAGDWFEALDGGVRVDPRNDADRIPKGLGTRLQYMAKGADDMTCRRYGGRRARGGQGPISIKRAGVSQCLRPKSTRDFFDALTRASGHGPQYAHAREEICKAVIEKAEQTFPENNSQDQGTAA